VRISRGKLDMLRRLPSANAIEAAPFARWGSVIAAAAVTLALCAAPALATQGGASQRVMAWMQYRAPAMAPVMSAAHAEYWLMMQLAMLAGFFLAYPVNWWLVKTGVKEEM